MKQRERGGASHSREAVGARRSREAEAPHQHPHNPRPAFSRWAAPSGHRLREWDARQVKAGHAQHSRGARARAAGFGGGLEGLRGERHRDLPSRAAKKSCRHWHAVCSPCLPLARVLLTRAPTAQLCAVCSARRTARRGGCTLKPRRGSNLVPVVPAGLRCSHAPVLIIRTFLGTYSSLDSLQGESASPPSCQVVCSWQHRSG